LNQKIAGRATLSYAHGDPTIDSTPSINYGGNRLTSDVVVLDENTIKPLIPNKPSQHADETYLLNIGRYEKAWRWSLNGDHAYDLALEAERPMLWDPQSQENSSLVIATKNNTWVDIIFKVFGNSTTLQPGHPLHKHSNPVYVLVSSFRPLCLVHLFLTLFRVPALASSIILLSQRLSTRSQNPSIWLILP
jgi:hypothetical protein